MADDPAADTIVELVLGAIGAAPGVAGRSEETFWAVRRAFEALARERPLLLVFEDIHWAEPTFLDLIEYLAGWSQTTPILLLCLARPDLLEQRPTWATPQPNTSTLTLDPLPPTVIDALLDRLGTEAELEPETRRRITLAAEGNPLFVEQFAALASDVGPGHELPVPPTIHALLAQRLDRLTQEERTVIERAAVIGRDFSLRSVTDISPADERSDTARQLLALMRRELIRPHEHPGDEDRFRFNHVLIRDTAYEAMPKQARAVLHERLAESAERDGPRPELDEVVGYHLEQSHRLRSELGPPDAETRALGFRAGERLASAGHRAFERADLAAAAGLLHRATRLLEDDEAALLPVSVELAATCSELGDEAEADAIASRSIAIAQAVGDRRLESHARLQRAWCQLSLSGRPDAVTTEATEVLEVLDELGDELGLAHAWRLLGIVEWQRVQFGRAEAAYSCSLLHAERAGARRRAAGLHSSLAGCVFFGPTPVPDAAARCRELLASPAIDRSATAAVHAFLGCLEAMRGRFDEARELTSQAVDQYSELGLTLRSGDARWYAALVELLAGNPLGAEQLLRVDAARLEPTAARDELSTHAWLLAEVLAAQGRYAEAVEQAEVSGQAVLDEDVFVQVSWRRTKGRSLAELDELDEADVLTAEAVHLAAATDSPGLRGDAALDRASVLFALEDVGAAVTSAQSAAALYDAKGIVVSLDRARTLLERIRGASPLPSDP